MAKKNDTTQFLNKELQNKALASGRVPIQAQRGISQAAVARVEKAVQRVPKELPAIGNVIRP